MSDPTAQEPTMEEILASIRRIISEDDTAATAEPAAGPEAKLDPAPAREPPAREPPAREPPAREPPAHAPAAAAPPPPPPLAEIEEEEVLELTEPAPVESHGDIDVFTPPAPAAAPPPRPPARATPAPAAERFAAADEEPLISGGPEDRVASHFGLLSKSLALPTDQRTLEDLVRELIRPLLKEWLDQHLAGIVEEKVQAEVERIARRR